MDDGNSWIGIVLFAASVILFAVMYGFGAAVQALNTSALEDERDEGNKSARSCRIWQPLEFHMSRDLWESHSCSRDWGS